MFAFDMYDSDGSGEISPNEVTQMLTDLFGKHEVKTNQHAKVMAAELLDHAKNFRDPFTIDTFRAFVKTHQALLFPAFQMQLALQRKFLGTAFWEKNADRRMEICNGKYISVGAFIAEHAQSQSVEAMQPLKFARIGEDPAAAPVVQAGGRAVRRKSIVHNHQQTSASNGLTLTGSAKLRFNAAAAGVQGFFASSGKHNKRTNSSPSKVYVASAKAPNMGSGTNTPSQSNAVMQLSRENSADFYATGGGHTGGPSPPRRKSHVENYVSPQMSPRGNVHKHHGIHHGHSSGPNSKLNSSNNSSDNLRGILSPPGGNANTNHTNLANNPHNKSAGNMRRASKEPKEFEDAINQIFSNMGANSPERRQHADGHAKLPRKNSKENSAVVPMHPNADKKPMRRTGTVPVNVANAVGAASEVVGAYVDVDTHALKHSPGKQHRRKSFG